MKEIDKPILDMIKEIKRIMRKGSWKWTQKALKKKKRAER